MTDKKILFTDLDGTLLNDDKIISDAAHKKILDMLECGHKLVLASGRPLDSILFVKEALKLPDKNIYATAFNGALLYDCYSHTTLSEQRIDIADAQSLFDAALEFGIHIQTFDENHHIICHKDDKELAFYQRNVKGIPLYTHNLQDVFSDKTKGPFKLLSICLEKSPDEMTSSKLLAFQNKLLSYEFANRFSFVCSTPYYMECFHKSAGKGNGLIRLCNILNIPLENAIAAGDAENDISMLISAGIGVAMSNGDLNIKAVADYVTVNDCNHDGIIEIIDRFIF